MNQKEFKVFSVISKFQPVYLRRICKLSKLPYGTVQAILRKHDAALSTHLEGKQKYFSFSNSNDALDILAELSFEEGRHNSFGIEMDRLDELESQAIFILREAYANFDNLCMLWSIGKDSTVLLWLARKAFLGHVPFPLVHIDTSFKIPEMIKYRDSFVRKYGLQLLFGKNTQALDDKKTFPDGSVSRIECCKLLKTDALKHTLDGSWKRYVVDPLSGKYEEYGGNEAFTGVIVGARADEEGSRSKERYFSVRGKSSEWDIASQPPELWNQFKTEFQKGTHVRVHPLLDWTELDIWKYIEREKIPIIDLYFDRGNGKRYRSLGCYPCTGAISSNAKNVSEIIVELESGKLAGIAERSGRKQDAEGSGGLEELRRGGYM